MNAPVTEVKPMNVYQAINAVQSRLASKGIAKDKEAQGYKFRGIDDVYNVIAPILSEIGLCILPRMISRTVSERESSNGRTLFFSIVEAEFDLVSSWDGSKHTIKTFGEAMDSGDKATNKAMSAAYKYACFQAFAIPVKGENKDSEEDTFEVLSPLELKYRQAAAKGSKHLSEIFAQEEQTKGFIAFWKTNSDRFKKAAASADKELAGAM